MTNKLKSMREIRDELADKYQADDSRIKIGPANSFKAGWDARDKIDNEALSVAVEALELTKKKTETDPAGEVELRARAGFIYYRVMEALTKISELMGEK